MELAVVGKSVTKVDSLEKATGKARYLDDIALAGMLHAKILRSKSAHAKIVCIDTTRARALPGVKAVITGSDIPGQHGPFIKDTPVLAKGKVRYIGEPIAAVAARDEATARQALDLIDVQYQELPTVFDAEEAMQAGAPIVHEELEKYIAVFAARRSGNVCSHTSYTVGDVEKGFAESDYVFEDTFITQEVHQAYLEPHGAVATVDVNGKVTVWTTTQSVYRTQASIHETLLLPTTKIRVIGTRVGGGFGGKVEALVQPVAVALAQRTGLPVKLTLTREEELIGTKPRHPAKVVIKTGVKKDGTLVARKVKAIFNTGAYADDGPAITGFGSMCAPGPYRVPNVRVDGYCVYTNNTTSGAYRGFGNPQVTFASESQLDMIAHRLGIDQVEFRLKNAVENGDVNTAGQVMPSVGLKECIRKASAAAAWGKPRSSPNRGLGVACMHHISGVLSACANVRINQDGTVSLLTAASDIGQGSDTILSQIAAEELGVRLEDVSIVTADTEATPYNWATCASRTTYTMGTAVKRASADAKRQLFEFAAEHLEANPADLVSANNEVFVKGSTDKKLSFYELGLMSHWAKRGPILGSASFMVEEPAYPEGIAEGFPFGPLTAWIFGAHVVEVEVDPDTGQVHVVQVTAAHDVGRAINPRNVEAQIEGGFAQGLGYTLYEEIKRDNGKVVNPSFTDYKLPTAADVPPIRPIIVEEAEPTGPFGAKGVGEPGLVATAAAIANAIHDAVGVRIKELPLSSERVLKALKQNS